MNITQYTSTLHSEWMMAIDNIESCRDGCRTSLLIAGVVLVPAIFYTSTLPSLHHHHPLHGNNFYTCSTNFLVDVCHIYSIKGSLYCITHTLFSWYKPASYWNLPVNLWHCIVFILGRTYLSICFLQNNHNCDNQKTVVLMVILFECVVCYYVACSPWDHHSDSSVWSVKVSQVQRLNKCGQPTHALDSTQGNSECPTVQVCKERQSQTCMH